MKYQDHRREIASLLGVQKVDVVRVIVGVLEYVTGYRKVAGKLGFTTKIKLL